MFKRIFVPKLDAPGRKRLRVQSTSWSIRQRNCDLDHTVELAANKITDFLKVSC